MSAYASSWARSPITRASSSSSSEKGSSANTEGSVSSAARDTVRTCSATSLTPGRGASGVSSGASVNSSPAVAPKASFCSSIPVVSSLLRSMLCCIPSVVAVLPASSEAGRTATTDGMQHSMDRNRDDTTGIEEQKDALGATAGDELTEAPEETPEAPRPGVKEVAEHVRTVSRAAELTDPSVFAEEPFSLDEEELARVMGDLAQDEAYADIVRTADERTGADQMLRVGDAEE